MTPARLATIDELAPIWMLPSDRPLTPDHLDTSFGRRAPHLLDIGIGNGDATRAWALAHPEVDVVGVELHRPGIAHLLRHLDADGPPNVRVVDGDITALLLTAPPASIGAIRVLFPDPWPKKRHHKRRLVDATFVREATDRLAPGGRLHLATDWPDYADAMRLALAAEPRLRPVVDHDEGETTWRTDRPDRPVTAYEQRGLDAGRAITDLVAVRG
ncbi:MAG: tRNA (guanosine(46)-N7)-methyltransferase TrmB [Actinobacteria bacterium]|nr:tRNA (guanosine(46)-N7)-methyltransferase TrmB [Actinomycetota bacterium]